MKRLVPLILFLSACATAPQAPAPSTAAAAAQPAVHVYVVSTTDMHGWYAGHPATRNAPAYGGLALIGGYVEALRANHPGQVIVVDSGDLFQGTLESNFFEGEPVVKGYNAIGYSAAAVGNHEFDFGPVGPDSVVRHPDQDPLGALKRNAGLAKFPFLSANITEKITGKTPSWLKRYTIVDAAGAKVGIIGLSTPDTPNVTTPANVAGLNFGDPVAATISAAKELRAAGADAVIVIAHMGGRCRNVDNPADASSCEAEQEAPRLLNALPKGTIDAYFAGHTHQQMRHYVNGVAAMQPLAYGREVAMLDMTVDTRHHAVTKTDMAPLTMVCAQVYAGSETCDPKRAPAGAALVQRTIEGRTPASVPAVAELLKPYIDQVTAKRNEPLGITLTAPVRRAYRRESALGDLLTDGMRAYLKTDIAVINSGGIRADLPAGALVYANMFDVSPFDNFPAIVTMTGAQIRDMLRLTTSGDRGILQASGIRYTFDEARPSDDRLTNVTLANGQPLDPNGTYRVAMVDFLAVGGDGLDPVMKQIPADRVTIDFARPIRELVIDAIKAMPQPVNVKPDGRVTVLNAKGGAEEP